MALSGSFNTNRYTTSSHGNIGLTLSWTGTQSVANNTTTISWTLKSFGTMSSGYYVEAGPVSVTIAGKTVLNTTSRFNMRGDGGYKKTGTITVSHTEEGLRNVTMSIRAAIYSTSVNCTGSATFTLNTINRYALITETQNFTDEDNPTFTFSNPSGAEQVTNLKARLKWTNQEQHQDLETDFEDIPELLWNGGQHTFNLNNEDRQALREACPTANSLPVTIDLQSTMNGTEYHHQKTITMEMINAAPTSGAVSFREMNDTVYAITGNRQTIVQKQSTMRIHTEPSTAIKGATVASYNLNINGHDYTPDANGNVEFIQPDVSGTYTATVTTTDSRGNSSAATVDITILQWTEPAANYTVARQQNFYAETDINVDGTIATITGSTMTITEKHKKVADPETAWTAEQTLPDAQTVTITLTVEDEWEIIIKVADAFAHKEYRVTVGKGTPLKFTDIKRRSFSINGLPDADNQLYIDGTIKSTGNITARGVNLPMIKSETEHPVGFWIDGSTIYEQTVILTSGVNISAGGTADLMNFPNKIMPLEFFSYRIGGTFNTLWTHIGAQWNNNKLQGYNPASAARQVDGFTIRYIYQT